MGPVNWLAVVLGAVAFFVVGALWYGPLFGKVWQREACPGERPQGPVVARNLGLTFLCELIVAGAFGHLVARTQPSPHVIMMMAVGLALAVMAPAIGIGYIHQRKSLTLFAIDTGHLAAGMAALGAVFVLLR